MNDGLYLFDEWVAEVPVVISRQANDLTQPATLQATFTNLFTLPDTSAIRSLLQNAEQLDAGGPNPYRRIPAFVLEKGERIFSGLASLESFQAGWKVGLSSAAPDLFGRLANIKLSDLELSRYDHLWNLESVAHYVGATDGVLYPLVDSGSMDNSILAQDTITPAVYARTLVEQMLQQCGYRASGDWLQSHFLRRIVLPFVSDSPTAHDQQWIDDRYARVGAPESEDIRLRNGKPISMILPLIIDNDFESGYEDGKLNCYKAELAKYVCPETMRVHVMAQVNIHGTTIDGAAEIRLSVERNGVQVDEGAYWSKAKRINILGLNKTPDPLNLDTYVSCRKGDELRIRLTGKDRTQIAIYNLFISRKAGEMWASFDPDPTVQQNDVWPVARNLPDLTCADVLKSVALMCCGTFDINEVRRTVELKTLNGVIDRETNATDLSHTIDESAEPEVVVSLKSYGRTNRLKWKEQSKPANKGYGDGVITCDAENIPAEETLFELPFAAVLPSANSVPGYTGLLSIETRTVTRTGSTVNVSKTTAPPCLVLVEPSKPITVVVNRVLSDLTTEPTAIQLTPCWWHHRPPMVATPDNNYSLAFDRPAGGQRQTQISTQLTLVNQFFTPLKRVLRRPRQLTVSVYLTPAEFASLDLYAPVRLKAVRAGSLDLNDNFYYLNQVSNYRAGMPCSLVLIAY